MGGDVALAAQLERLGQLTRQQVSGPCLLTRQPESYDGPAGVGKSSFATQYVSASAVRHPCAVYLFDERRSIFLHRCDSLGMDVSAHVASGQTTIEQIEPGDMSPGEFAHRVRHRVRFVTREDAGIDRAHVDAHDLGTVALVFAEESDPAFFPPEFRITRDLNQHREGRRSLTPERANGSVSKSTAIRCHVPGIERRALHPFTESDPRRGYARTTRYARLALADDR